MRSALLRNSLRLGVAAFVTAALSLWFERIAYVWYPMLAVVTVMEDGDDLSLQAAAMDPAPVPTLARSAMGAAHATSEHSAVR